MAFLNLSLLLSYLLSSLVVPLQGGRLQTGRLLPLTLLLLLWLHVKSPHSRRMEATRKDSDRESALSSVGQVNVPAWSRPRTSTLGSRKMGRRMRHMQNVMVEDQGESRWKWMHSFGKAALAPDLCHTLALNDGRSNELCLLAPSGTGSYVSFTIFE